MLVVHGLELPHLQEQLVVHDAKVLAVHVGIANGVGTRFRAERCGGHPGDLLGLARPDEEMGDAARRGQPAGLIHPVGGGAEEHRNAGQVEASSRTRRTNS